MHRFNLSSRPAAYAFCFTLFSLLVAGCQHGPNQDRPIALPYAAPYESGIRVRPAIRRECDLERRVARQIASEIRGQFSQVKLGPAASASTPGMALDLKIVHVEGKSGAARGHKSLSVTGTLYDNGMVVGNFIATRRTKHGRHTCRMLWENIDEIAEDVSNWLDTPSRDAYLGDAQPGDSYRPDLTNEEKVPSQAL